MYVSHPVHHASQGKRRRWNGRGIRWGALCSHFVVISTSWYMIRYVMINAFMIKCRHITHARSRWENFWRYLCMQLKLVLILTMMYKEKCNNSPFCLVVGRNIISPYPSTFLRPTQMQQQQKKILIIIKFCLWRRVNMLQHRWSGIC